MALPLVIVAVPLVLLYFAYAHILHPLFLSPLRHVPVPHPLCRFSSAWILWQRFQKRENRSLKTAHDRLGPVLLLGPNEVSVNCTKGGVSVVYTGTAAGAGGGGSGGGMEKGEWYGFFTNYDNVPNMFSTAGSKAHSLRKRMISNTYSKSCIQSSAPLKAQMTHILHERLFPLLERVRTSKEAYPDQPEIGVLNVYYLLSGLTMDVVTGYLYGLAASSKFTSEPEACKHFLDLYNSRHGFTFWGQEMGWLHAVASVFGLGTYLIPEHVRTSNREIEAWTLAMCDEARRNLMSGKTTLEVQDTPVVYQQMAAAMLRNAEKKTTLELPIADPYLSPSGPEDRHMAIASETLDHLAAGFDTSSITLTYLLHQISLPHNQHYQAQLRKELLTLSPNLLFDLRNTTPEIPDAKALDQLPLLHAILWETLRLHSAIPGPEPRVTPAGGCLVGPGLSSSSPSSSRQPAKGATVNNNEDQRTYFLPSGMRISASAGLLHQNADVYPEPLKWLPERWLAQQGTTTSSTTAAAEEEREKRKEMDRWFWAFGSGGRMCVGSNLAIYRKFFFLFFILHCLSLLLYCA